MTTELARREDVAPSPIDEDQLAVIEAMLPAAIEAGAVENLAELSRQAEAARLYEVRRGYLEMANRLSRLKVTAEAGIGQIDLRENPATGRRSSLSQAPLQIGGGVLPKERRADFRKLGVLAQRDLLVPAMDTIDQRGEDVGTAAVKQEAARLGAMFVPEDVLRKIVRRELERRKCSARTFALEVGLGPGLMYLLSSPTPRKVRAARTTPRCRVLWVHAQRIAEAVGIDPLSLPTAPPLPRRHKSSRRWLTKERRLSGGRWDETYSRFRRCLDEFAATAGEDTKWDEAYAHFYALEQIIGTRMKRG